MYCPYQFTQRPRDYVLAEPERSTTPRLMFTGVQKCEFGLDFLTPALDLGALVLERSDSWSLEDVFEASMIDLSPTNLI